LLSDEYKDKLASIGAKALNDDEISWMFFNGIDGVWLSDYELARKHNPSWTWNDDNNFAPTPTGIGSSKLGIN
jgi:hypothetical protein